MQLFKHHKIKKSIERHLNNCMNVIEVHFTEINKTLMANGKGQIEGESIVEYKKRIAEYYAFGIIDVTVDKNVIYRPQT